MVLNYKLGNEKYFEELDWIHKIGYQKRLIERNHKMAKTIDKKLKEKNSYIFALGVKHFLGDGDNVIDLLKEAGYKIDRVLPAAQLNAHDEF